MKAAHELKEIPFPACAKECALIGYLGAGECDAVCPFKFPFPGDDTPTKEEGTK